MTERDYAQLVRLLAEPDPVNLPARRHQWTCAGDPRRMETAMPGILLRWLQWRLLAAIDGEVGPVKRQKYARARKTSVVVKMEKIA